MKKIIIFLFFVIITLSSCVSKQDVKQEVYHFPFDSDINVQYEGKEYLINFKINSENNMSLTFKSPQTLKNMQILVEDGKTSLIYHGISIPLEGEYVKDNGILLLQRIFSSDKNTFDSAKMVRISGVKYCRQRYISEGSTVDIFFIQGSDSPSFIEATVNGRSFKITFVNE